MLRTTGAFRLILAVLINLVMGASESHAAKIQDMSFHLYGSKDRPRCTFELTFIGAADGIDGDVLQKVKKYIDSSSLISSAKFYPWGAEGEETFCLDVNVPQNEKLVFTALKDMMPAKPSHGRILLKKDNEIYEEVP